MLGPYAADELLHGYRRAALEFRRQMALNAFKAKAEAYFARQMGMTVPQWREAQVAHENRKASEAAFARIRQLWGKEYF